MRGKRISFIVGIGVVVAISAIALVIFLTIKTTVNRPQEPSKPYPYFTEDLTFKNSQAGITLAGTLTMPSQQGSFPAVILITGSGPQNRDEEISGHKPFLIIADHLTRQVLAVLRFDDRGVAKSTGEFEIATSADFASDVASAIEFLKTREEIDKERIGLIGHSEGGMIAPMVAANTKDVSYMVLLAGPGMATEEILLIQEELISRAEGVSDHDLKEYILAVHKKVYQLIKTSTDRHTLKSKLIRLIEKTYDDVPPDLMKSNMSREDVIQTQSKLWSSNWYRYFLNYNPSLTLEKVSCPVLALNGEKDLQVTPKENLSAIRSALSKGGNANVTVKELPNLNHLFQNCETGSPTEYNKIKETFSPLALQEISDWILAQIK